MALCECGKLGSLIITCATFDQSSLLTRGKAILKTQRIWTLLAWPWGVPSRRLGLIKYWSFISHQRQNIERIRENENHDQFHCDITRYNVDLRQLGSKASMHATQYTSWVNMGSYLRIYSCLACVYRVMDARRKFGEHERCVRVARGDSRVQL